MELEAFKKTTGILTNSDKKRWTNNSYLNEKCIRYSVHIGASFVTWTIS